MAKVGRKTIDITGKRSGTLTALRPDGKDSSGSNVWLCRCDCGKEVRLRVNHINRSLAKSCGCQNPRGTTHGKSRIKGPDREVYKIWVEMKRRCYDPTHDSFDRYGGRGIYVCAEWLNDVAQFITDMGLRPPAHQIDRSDNNGPYAPGNCRWVESKQNARNTRANTNLKAFGRTQCLSAWAEEYGMEHTTLLARLSRGWDLERALTEEVDSRRGVRQDVITLTAFGQTKPLKVWAAEYGMRLPTLVRRLKQGWSAFDALTKPLGSSCAPRTKGTNNDPSI